MLNIVEYIVESIYLHRSFWLEVYLLKLGWGRRWREIWWKYSLDIQGRKHITALPSHTPSFTKEQLSPQRQPTLQKHFTKAVPCCGNREAHGNPLCTEMKTTNPDSRCEGGDLGADRPACIKHLAPALRLFEEILPEADSSCGQREGFSHLSSRPTAS